MASGERLRGLGPSGAVITSSSRAARSGMDEWFAAIRLMVVGMEIDW